MREEEQECLTSHMEMATAWSAKEKQRLNADRQRLERAKDHLRLDKEHMETENVELNKEILQQTEEFRMRKAELAQERGLLQVKTNYILQLGWRSQSMFTIALFNLTSIIVMMCGKIVTKAFLISFKSFKIVQPVF